MDFSWLVTPWITFVLKKLFAAFAGTRAGLPHGFENVGQTGLRQFPLERGLSRSEDLLQRGLNAVADRAGLIRPPRVRGKWLIRFHRLINIGQRDASRR